MGSRDRRARREAARGKGGGEERRPWKKQQASVGKPAVVARSPGVQPPPRPAPPRDDGERSRLPPHVTREGSRIFTSSLDPVPVYGEMMREANGEHLRAWDPRRSKLAAALLLGARVRMDENDRILYLGAASGTTVSHVSDIARGGEVFAVESAPTEFSKLLGLAERRRNIFPVFANARKPGLYSAFLERADMVYQDIAQRDQVRILETNLDRLATAGTRVVLMLKTRSIDVAERPEKVAREAVEAVQRFAEVDQVVGLHPFAREHWCIVGRKRSRA